MQWFCRKHKNLDFFLKFSSVFNSNSNCFWDKHKFLKISKWCFFTIFTISWEIKGSQISVCSALSQTFSKINTNFILFLTFQEFWKLCVVIIDNSCDPKFPSISLIISKCFGDQWKNYVLFKFSKTRLCDIQL